MSATSLALLLRPFRRLQGRLALSYIMVTLAAAFTLEAATILVTAATLQAAAAPSPKRLVVSLQAVASELAPYLDGDRSDTAAVNTWLARWAGDVRTIRSGDAPAVTDSRDAPQALLDLAKLVGADATMVVVGRNGRPLAACEVASSEDIGQSARVGNLLGQAPTQAVLRAAADTSADTSKAATSADLASALPDGRTLAAVSITDGQRHLLGILLIATTLAQAQPLGLPRLDYIGLAAQVAFPAALWLVIVACLVGSLFGVIVAHGLTRRLHAITQAAMAWSHGDFQATAHLDRRDELGELAHELNGMAGQIQTLLAMREQFALVSERNRLARDLHDAIKQQVFALSLLVAAAKARLPPSLREAQQYLTEAEALAEQTRAELTSLIYALRPAPLDHQRLSAAVREYVGDWSRRSGIAAETQVAHRCEELDLPQEVEDALMRVTQEALANVARHSGARQAWVSLTKEETRVRLTVVDDGGGFDVAQAQGTGMGLISMRERVEARQGTLNVTSVMGQTRVVAEIPVGQETSATTARPPNEER